MLARTNDYLYSQMTFEQFLRAFESLLQMALTSGLQTLQRPSIHPADYSLAETRRFVAGCHRGYAKAQAYMVRLLEEIETSNSLSGSEKLRCTFLVRGVAETMALSILGDRAYMIRRLPLFDEPLKLDFATLRATLTVAEKLNSESRQTFALLADLTLSIQIADLLRVDFRKPGNRFEFIELKAGAVNSTLLAVLRDYPRDAAGIGEIDTDERILPRHRKQAKRMLRQQIRLGQIMQILDTDSGVDIQHDRPIQLSSRAIDLREYDDVLRRLLTTAEADGGAFDVVDECLVLGVGRRTTTETAEATAMRALATELSQLDRFLRDVSPDIANEVDEALGGANPFSSFNLLESTLGQVAVRPLTTWAIERHQMLRLIKREAAIVSAIHLTGFLRTARSAGVDIRFATVRETGRFMRDFAAREIPRWNGRALVRRSAGVDVVVTGGLLSRFLYNLTEPRSFLSQMTELEEEALSAMSSHARNDRSMMAAEDRVDGAGAISEASTSKARRGS